MFHWVVSYIKCEAIKLKQAHTWKTINDGIMHYNDMCNHLGEKIFS